MAADASWDESAPAAPGGAPAPEAGWDGAPAPAAAESGWEAAAPEPAAALPAAQPQYVPPQEFAAGY